MREDALRVVVTRRYEPDPERCARALARLLEKGPRVAEGDQQRPTPGDPKERGIER